MENWEKALLILDLLDAIIEEGQCEESEPGGVPDWDGLSDWVCRARELLPHPDDMYDRVSSCACSVGQTANVQLLHPSVGNDSTSKDDK